MLVAPILGQRSPRLILALALGKQRHGKKDSTRECRVLKDRLAPVRI